MSEIALRYARRVEARRLALALMAQHGLHDWRFAFNRRKRSLGMCHFTEKVIALSIYLVDCNGEDEIREFGGWRRMIAVLHNQKVEIRETLTENVLVREGDERIRGDDPECPDTVLPAVYGGPGLCGVDRQRRSTGPKREREHRQFDQDQLREAEPDYHENLR